LDFEIGILDLKMSTFSLQANWVDFLIILTVAYFVSEAWRVGFWVIVADFFGFLLSLLIALRGYTFTSDILQTNFSLARSVSNALGFLITAAFSEAILGFLFSSLIRKIPYKFWKKPWNNIAATIPAAGQGLILISFVLTLVIGLPISPKLKSDVTDSKIGGILVQKTSGIEARVNEIFGGLVEDSLTYLTVRPGSTELIPITVDKQELAVDEASEFALFRLVNDERRKRGVPELAFRPDVVLVARAHARDMWEREYFGHVSPDGEDVVVRMERENVSFNVVGENLALAPTVATSHNGLMQSEGHRANILETEFNRMGIGVIDNGIYGKMFVQVFTD